MAFYVELENGQGITWYVNSKPLHLGFDLLPKEKILLFQADGDELDFIISCIEKGGMGGLPWCRHICKWRGDYAQFIWENLPYHANKPIELKNHFR